MKEEPMNDQRRTILKGMTAMAAAGVSGIATAKSGYDPKAKFELKVSKVPFRKNAKGRQLMARIYQPVGTGPFPVVLDLHGGAWQRKDRTAEEPMDRAIAASGVLVVAIDMTLSGEAPYPACIQDASYGIRWLKVRAKEWKGDALTLGLYGSSSGGHVAEMLMLRPNDARYNAIPLEGEAKTDTSVACRHALPDQRYVRALGTGCAQAEREPAEGEQDVLQPVGNDPRGQSARDPRAQG